MKIYYLNYIEVSKITRIPKSDKLKKTNIFFSPLNWYTVFIIEKADKVHPVRFDKLGDHWRRTREGCKSNIWQPGSAVT